MQGRSKLTVRKYRVLIEGRRCLIVLDAEVKRCGFYSTRFIEAGDAHAAEQVAIELIREELKGILCNDPSSPPLMRVDEIDEVASFGDNRTPGKGFTWYLEQDN